jgi:D-sedoheptulose 7-phosphate isomerase
MGLPVIQNAVKAHQEAVNAFFETQSEELLTLAEKIAHAFDNEGQLLLCGNGGSACDAMHIAGEFVGRFVNDRKALPAIALTADTGAITAIGNDYGFEEIFSRQVEAYGKKGDVLIGISTSGSSRNVINALEKAKEQGLYTALLTGEKGKDSTVADLTLFVPSVTTARVQEVHIAILHIMTGLVEEILELA